MFSANRHNTHFGGIAFIYNPTNDHYEEIPLPPREGMFDWFIPLSDGRAVAGAVGTYAGRDFLSVSIYESATRRFGPIIDLKLPGLSEFADPSSAVMLTNGDILLLDSRQAWRYQPDQRQVVLTAPKRTGAYHEVVALSDGRALVLSGNGPGRAPDLPFVTVEGEIYDPQTDGWRTITPIPPGPRSGFEATVLADGRVMVAGGSTLNFDQLAQVDIYDPRTDTWQPAAPLPITVSGFRLTPLRDGMILMTGGEPVTPRAPQPYPPIYEKSAYAYNPRDNSWIRVGQMTAPHAYHQAQRLPDGRVLLIVGTAGELFTPPCWPQFCSSCP
ncbi:MAG: kelch repeat-containing protein [Thermomicrobiales bacterium]